LNIKGFENPGEGRLHLDSTWLHSLWGLQRSGHGQEMLWVSGPNLQPDWEKVFNDQPHSLQVGRDLLLTAWFQSLWVNGGCNHSKNTAIQSKGCLELKRCFRLPPEVLFPIASGLILYVLALLVESSRSKAIRPGDWPRSRQKVDLKHESELAVKRHYNR